jgi:hypothetical protein
VCVCVCVCVCVVADRCGGACSLHARWAAGVDDAIVANASPAVLWWWQEPLFALFETAINTVNDVDAARGAVSFVRLCGAAPSLATRFYAKERDRLGKGLRSATTSSTTTLYTILIDHYYIYM